MLSYIIPYRESGPERRRNLDVVLRWLATLPGLDVIVVEQDAVPRLAGALPHPHLRRVFAYNSGPFNKSWGLNTGFRLAMQDTVAFADADVVVPTGLPEAAAACRRGFGVAKPYRAIIDLGEADTQRVAEAFNAREALPEALTGTDRAAEGEAVVLAGGVVVMRGDAFVRLGGFDERFVGWGGEDDAMTRKMERVRMSTVEAGLGVALHLAHPRPHGQTFGQAHYAANRMLLAGYDELDDAALQRLGEVSWQMAGRAEKYVQP